MRIKITSVGIGGERFVELPSAGGVLQIGRHKASDIELADSSVSRVHARLTVSQGNLFIEDLGSRGGTYVNDVRTAGTVPVKFGDRVRIGTFRLSIADAEPQTHARTVENAGMALSERALRDGDFASAFRDATLLCTDEMMALKSRIHNLVLSQIDPLGTNANKLNDAALAQQAEECLDRVMREVRHEIPDDIPLRALRQALLDELVGYGPITPMLRMPEISEVMVNGPDRIFVESKGRLYETGVRFFNEKHLVQIIQRIVEPLGRHVDDASPMVDARLPDGSRVNAVVPPLALDGTSVTIRKFSEKKLTTDDLISFGSMTKDMALFLEEAVRARQNILVSGGTGSGKTTLLNILSQFIPEGERIVTVEDSAELKLSHRNIVRLEARPANVEGKGRITIRDLVINCLRMRPDRIIVGECRGAEALDMLQAMNTGHDGSLTTAHANNPRDALSRLENMVMMAGYDLPSSAIREQISSAIDLIVQQSRLGDGSRKIVKIVEVTGREGDVIQMQDIFEFRQTGIGDNGAVRGEYSATGNIPMFVDEQRKRNVLKLDMSVFVPKV
ncbi:MAG: Flp pilus assembly complex ATPase component TadA [Kiritimatiellae bacterium]|nr:Flp pilus assembly complex ATPase component TadA [Kiritimatiellia bacterium]MBQ3099076.1 Flp pilus assembly complex ATPase component TadA [Kiritimatiellia bacterium]